MDQQLKKVAKEMFEAYPQTDVFLVTTDKQFFFLEQSSDAQAHQDYLNRPTEATHKLERITRDEANAEEVVAPPAEEVPTAKSTKEQIAAYLTLKGVAFDPAEKKDELVAKLAAYLESLKVQS